MKDAARITPYPFVVHQVPSCPDTADSSRTTKKKRQRSRADRNPHQEDEVRFNTGPVRHGPSLSRRVSRHPGRSYADDRNGIPDYPPPTFQEAINTGPLSQSSLSLATATMSLAPDDNQDDSASEPTPTPRRMEIDPPNEVSPVDNTLESDDSALVIINKNEVPVCSTDFPSPKHETKKDWFKRRKQEVPIASTSSVEKSDDPSRAKKPPRITIPVNPDPSGMHEDPSMSSPKRRFLSLSPIKTFFPSKTAQQDGSLSATSPPSSPKFSLGNKNSFNSRNSLSASSLLRPQSSPKKDSISRRLFSHKGKERAKDALVPEKLQDNWEVVEQTADDERGDTVRHEADEHPQSLMSVVMDSFSANGSTTTFLRHSPTKLKSRSATPSDESHSAAPTSPLTTGNPDTSLQTKPPFEGQIKTDTPQTSASPTPLAMTPTASPPQSSPTDLVTSSREQPPPSKASQSLPISQRPNVTIDPQAMQGDVSTHNLEMCLPMTPIYQTNHELNMPSVIDDLKEKLPPPLVPVAIWPAASHSIPDLLTESDHSPPSVHSPSVCTCGTRHNINPSFKSIPSPLGMHMYPAYRTPTPPQFTHLTKAPAVEESSIPTRPHYAGRPLPRPPPTLDVQKTNPVLTVNTGPPGTGKANGPLDSIRKEGKGKEKEGLLIDLEDTSLDTNPLVSPTTTIRSGSDESRYHSQVYLPLISSPSSSAIFTREPLASELFKMSFPSPQSASTVVIPGSNHLNPQHRYQCQHNHRFPYPFSQYQPNGFSKSTLELPARFHDGIHDSLQADVHRQHGFPRDTAGGSLSHCCSCEHSVMPWPTHTPPPSMSVTHGAYQPHYHHHHLTMDNARQRHHLAHLSY